MNIRKISLSDSGFKGMECHYYQEEEKNGRTQLVLTKKYPKNPVHLGLEKMFKDLRIHLLQICGIVNEYIPENIKNQFIAETMVKTIEMDGQTIVMSGERFVFEDKYTPLKTCKLEEEDGYEHYEELKNLVIEICHETKEYLAGTKKVDDVELAVRYVESGRAKNLTMADVEGMSDDEKKIWATEFLENTIGSTVYHPDEVSTDDGEELHESIDKFEPLETEFAAVVDEDPEFPVMPEMTAEPEPTEVEITDGDIEIPVNATPAKEKKPKKQEVVAETKTEEEEF